MTVKKTIRLMIIVATLSILGACAKTPGSSDGAVGTCIDKYGCVMYKSMPDSADIDVVAVKNLSPKGAFKYFLPYDFSLEERKVEGEVIMYDGTHAMQDYMCFHGENIVAVGTSCLGEVVFIKEMTNGDEVHQAVEVIGEDGGVTKEIAIPERYSVVPGYSDVYLDAFECVHIVNAVKREGGDIVSNYIVIQNGEAVYCRELSVKKESSKLIVLPDMSVALDTIESNSDGRVNHEIVQFSGADYSFTTICKYSTSEVISDEEIVALNIFDESHLVYMTCNGVYISNRKLENAEMVFAWEKNGVSFNSVVAPFEEYSVCASDTGEILILKEGFRRDEFLRLSKLPDNIVSVEILGLGGMRSYGHMVFDFNVTHPEYHITIRNDIDKTNLLTRMTAGDGPEIIEEGVIDVRELKKVWEPLENLVSKDAIDNLNKGAIICGSIDGELYGAASSYTIDTLITGENLDDWNYDTFINAIETNTKLETISSTGLLEGKLPVLESVFCDGIEETYFINPKGEIGVIDRDKLEKVISLIEKYQNFDNYDCDLYSMLADKSMLCARFLVSRPIDLCSIYYAAGDVGKVIGYPGKKGSKHYLNSSGTLFARSNISDEKKKVISEFFEYMLSYEGQKNAFINTLDEGFSVRDDVQNEQIDALKDREGEKAGLGGVIFTFEKIDVEEARDELSKIMNNSLPARDWNNPLYDILWEEFDNYFAGGIDINTLEDHLNKRISIYIEEMK